MIRYTLSYALLLAALVSPSLASFSVSNPETRELSAPASNDQLGAASAASDHYYAISAPGRSTNGVVLVYNHHTGDLLYTLSSEFSQSGVLLDASMAISDQYLAVGLPSLINGQGAVLVWDLTDGSLYHTFTHSSPNDGDHFGASLALSGNHLLVGAPEDEPDSTGALTQNFGSATLFDLSSTSPLHHFTASSPNNEDSYGFSVALSTDYLVIGCPGYDIPSGGGDEGAVFTYSPTSYSSLNTISIEASNAQAALGYQVDIKDGAMIASAYQGFSTDNKCYLFDLSSGAVLSTFASPSSTSINTFGYRIAIDNTIAIGDRFANNSIGQVYLYDLQGNYLRTIENPSSNSGDQFSASLAYASQSLFLGAPGYDTESFFNTGITYIYQVNERINLSISRDLSTLTLTWDSIPGVSYNILSTQNIDQSSWATVNDIPITASSSSTNYQVPLSLSKQFFTISTN